jgi:hypothetical protein
VGSELPRILNRGTSENSVIAKFAEFHTSTKFVNKGKRKRKGRDLG